MRSRASFPRSATAARGAGSLALTATPADRRTPTHPRSAEPTPTRRREGLRYRKNEVYIDVLESVNLLMGANGISRRRRAALAALTSSPNRSSRIELPPLTQLVLRNALTAQATFCGTNAPAKLL